MTYQATLLPDWVAMKKVGHVTKTSSNAALSGVMLVLNVTETVSNVAWPMVTSIGVAPCEGASRGRGR